MLRFFSAILHDKARPDHKSVQRPWATLSLSRPWPLSAYLTWPCWSSDIVAPSSLLASLPSVDCQLCVNTLFSCLPLLSFQSCWTLLLRADTLLPRILQALGHGGRNEVQVPLESRLGPSPFGSCFLSLSYYMIYFLLHWLHSFSSSRL